MKLLSPVGASTRYNSLNSIMGDIITQSPNDLNEYRYVALPNGLRALLVSGSASSDKNAANMSAVALCVGIGSFTEPDSVPGLAHFLEHMIFMGSKQYPKENSFDQFLSSHGGSTDGQTDVETTNFVFTVKRGNLKEAMKRFASFFIEPLLNKDSMERESKVVHAEWLMNGQSEKVRVEQLLATLVKLRHPLGKFNWGNTDSLQRIPEENGVDVHNVLVKFRKQYYSAHLMTLVVHSQDSLDELERWVALLFSRIPQKHQRYSKEMPGATYRVFDAAYWLRPSVIIIDEILVDSESHGKLDRTLMKILDGSAEMAGIFLIGTTNKPESLCAELTRPGRIEERIELGLPNVEERRLWLDKMTSGWRIARGHFKTIAGHTQEFSTADFASLTRRAKILAGERNNVCLSNPDTTTWRNVTGDGAVTAQDLDEALKAMTKTSRSEEPSYY